MGNGSCTSGNYPVPEKMERNKQVRNPTLVSRIIHVLFCSGKNEEHGLSAFGLLAHGKPSERLVLTVARLCIKEHDHY